MFRLFKRAAPVLEKRAGGSGYTAAVMDARASYIAGASGMAELTATVQTCIGLWEGAFAAAAVKGTDLLNRRTMALLGRALALRGEAVFLISEQGLMACSDWDLSTRDGEPRAYRLSVSEQGGAVSRTALPGEVLHLRIGSSLTTPWAGTSPLRRSSLTAGLLQTLETALGEVYDNAPIGTTVLPFPESPDVDMEALGRGFRGRRGRVLLRESVNVTAAGGAAPAMDWRGQDMTPDLSKAMMTQNLAAARDAVCGVFGVLPGLLNPTTTGPLVREAQRHLASWTLQPIAGIIAEEASAKLGDAVEIDVVMPLQAFDVGGRARAFASFVGGIAQAKEAGLTPTEIEAALKWIELAENDGRA